MKTMKRIVAVMMTVLMLVSTVSIGMTSTAASKKKVSKIKLNKTSVTIYVGDTYKLKATVSPSNASNKKVSWSSSNKKVATVSSSGKVTAKKAGKATITVKAKDGSGKKATCKVTVKKPTLVKKIELNKSSVKLSIGKTTTVKATISPSNATDKNVTWSSSDKKVATVSSKGKITAKKAGTATITCKAKDGSGKKATVKVTVTAVKVKSVKLNTTSASLATNATLALKATVSPANATNKNVTWKSSNTSVATVSSSGVVTAKKKGTVTITATAKDGSKKSASCTIKINSIGAASVSLDKTTYTNSPGSTVTLKATFNPSNVSKKTLTWKSSNTSVAKVDSNGKVSLLKNGTATITATTTDGTNKSAKCTVTVKTIGVTSVKLSASKAELLSGGTYKLTATVSPSNATNKAVTWTSSNSSVATVDSNGNIRALKAGTATITVTTKDGSKKATCIVTVKPKATSIAVLPSTFSSWYEGKPNGSVSAVVQPEGASQKVTWSSSNTSYVTVDANGKVTVKKGPGILDFGSKDITITATATDGSGVKGSYTITIKDKVDLKDIEFASNNTTVFFIGQTYKPLIKFDPENASETEVTYTSSNPDVAKVQDDGSIHMVGKGSAIITATPIDKPSAKKTLSIKVVEPSLEFSSGTTNIETLVGKTFAMTVTATPDNLLTELGIKFDVEDESVIKLVSQARGKGYCVATFEVIGSGVTNVTASTDDGKISTETPITVTAAELVVNTYYEDLDVGSEITIDPKVMVGENELDTTGVIEYVVSSAPVDNVQYFASKDGSNWANGVSADGTFELKIKKELPTKGAYIDITYRHGGSNSSSKKVTERIYFTGTAFTLPPATFDQFKAYSSIAANATAKRDKDVNYINTKVNSSDMDISASGSLLAELVINPFITRYKDSLLADMGISAGDIVYEMFSTPTFETESGLKPMAINCDESMVESVTVIEHKGEITYEMRLELKDQAKTALSSVASSQYAKVMPVLDKTYVDNFTSQIKQGTQGSSSSNVDINYGTLNQTYRDGYVVLTINKVTGQIEKCEYGFKSDMDFKNAKMYMDENMDGIGTLNIDVSASFTMTVEEKFTYYNLTY